MRRALAPVLLMLLVAGCAAPEGPSRSLALAEVPAPDGGPLFALGYVDEDEHYDLVVAARDALHVHVDGAHNATATLACVGCDLAALLLADIDEDGDADVYALGADATLHAWRNDGGAFAALDVRGAFAGKEGRALAAADLDNDGDLDLLALTDAGLELREHDGIGLAATRTLHEADAANFALVFLDDDMLLDVALATRDAILLLRNDPDANGTLLAPTSFELRNARFLVPADWDGDQRVDLLAGASDGVRLLRNGGGKLRDGGILAGPAAGALAADMDNDGALDLVVRESGAVRVLTRGADGALAERARASATESARASLGVADLDRDGRLDVLTLPGAVLLNRLPAGHHLSIRLMGNESVADAIGVKTTLSSGTSLQLRQSGGVAAPFLVLPHDAHFGLGSTTAESYGLAILWPSGILQFDDAEAKQVVDRRIEARESMLEAPWDTC